MSDRVALLVIGGGPAGLSAARAFRQAGGAGPVAIVSDEARMPYRRPPLTKELLRREITEDELALESEDWLAEHAVSLIGGRAVALDGRRREVTLSGGRSLRYDQCVLATGAEPRRLPLPGADDPAVRVLRSLDDLRELERRLASAPAAIVIGSGFIGCEIAASLRRRDVDVTLVSDEPAPNARRLGAAVAQRLAAWLAQDGVTLMLGAQVDSIARGDGALCVRAGSREATAPLVVMAVGVAPRGELAAAGEATVSGGAVVVDSAMRTSVPGVLAAGDACLADNRGAGRPLRVEHWGDALAQGSIAGLTAAGESAEWDEVPGFWSAIGDRTLKYAAWGDGYDSERVEPVGDGGFVAWYGREGRVAGVLCHEADESYDRGRAMIARGARWEG